MINDYCDPNSAADARPGTEHSPESKGLTKREYFAALAMQGLYSNSRELKRSMEYAENAGIIVCVHIAGLAVESADALIAELNANE